MSVTAKKKARRREMVAKWEALLSHWTDRWTEEQVKSTALRVTAWSNGNGIYGLRISTRDRKKHFKRKWSHVKVELDGDVHQFELMPRFWNRVAEFHDRGDPAIGKWLRRHHIIPWPNRQTPRLQLIPLGGGRFRLLK
jgi:hypothetical protein